MTQIRREDSRGGPSVWEEPRCEQARPGRVRACVCARMYTRETSMAVIPIGSLSPPLPPTATDSSAFALCSLFPGKPGSNSMLQGTIITSRGGKKKAQRGHATCLRSHSRLAAMLQFTPRYSDSLVCALTQSIQALPWLEGVGAGHLRRRGGLTL